MIEGRRENDVSSGCELCEAVTPTICRRLQMMACPESEVVSVVVEEERKKQKQSQKQTQKRAP